VHHPVHKSVGAARAPLPPLRSQRLSIAQWLRRHCRREASPCTRGGARTVMKSAQLVSPCGGSRPNMRLDATKPRHTLLTPTAAMQFMLEAMLKRQ